MANLSEILDAIGAWGKSWRDRAITAEAAAAAANAAAEAATAHADAVVANDAAEDLAQLEQAKAEAAAEAQAKWDELSALDAPAPEPPAEEPSE